MGYDSCSDKKDIREERLLYDPVALDAAREEIYNLFVNITRDSKIEDHENYEAGIKLLKNHKIDLLCVLSILRFSDDHHKVKQLIIDHLQEKLKEIIVNIKACIDISAQDVEQIIVNAGSNGKLVRAMIFTNALINDAELAKKLIQLNIVDNTNCISVDGLDPLMLASIAGNLEVVKLLYEKGANVNQISLPVFYLLSENKYPHCTVRNGFPLIFAVMRGHIEIVEFLLKKNAEVDKVDCHGIRSLICAVEKGNTEILKLLLENGANVNQSTEDPFNPLIIASLFLNVEVVELLLKYGADVNCFYNLEEQRSPLICACLPCDESDAERSNNSKARTKIMELLLKNKANINHSDNVNGETALTLSAYNGFIDAVQLLLQNGADVNKITRHGHNALMIAVARGHVQVAKLLLEHNFDLTKTDCDGDGLLTLATQSITLVTESDCIDMVQLLVTHINSLSLFDKEKLKQDYGCALFYACKFGNFDIAACLLQAGADVNFEKTYISKIHDHEDKCNRNALIEAAQTGNVKIVQMLLNYGAKLELTDEYGELDVVAGKFVLSLIRRNSGLKLEEIVITEEVYDLLKTFEKKLSLQLMVSEIDDFPRRSCCCII